MSEDSVELKKWMKKVEEQLKDQEISCSQNVVELNRKFSINLLKSQNDLMEIFETNFVTKEYYSQELTSQLTPLRNICDSLQK